MTITYNNASSGDSHNFITFTDIPNILKISDDGGGTLPTFTMYFFGNLKGATLPTGDLFWYITILGETVTSVNEYSNAFNKNFYPATDATSTAASVAKALRNCPTIAANFTVEHDGTQVKLRARGVGHVTYGLTTNISTSYFDYTFNEGSATSRLYNSKVNVDIYQSGTYITSLEKNYYGSDVSFNLSPMLTTLAEVGKTKPYDLKLSYTNASGYTSLGTIGTNYISQGYMCNQGEKCFQLGNNIILAANYNRGEPKTSGDNRTTLYVYQNTIPLSIYKNTNGSVGIDIYYLNTAYNVMNSEDYNVTVAGDSKLKNITIPLSQEYFSSATYVDIVFEDTGARYRYNVIKPLKATEYNQRILWRNSYGGISFFDFTGARTESRNLDTKTYQKNIYDYYTASMNELDKVYDNDVEYTVSLKSHLIDGDGRWLFNDLLQSPMVWTTENGESYAIILSSVNIEETDRNDIYEITIKYKYSMKPSII